jgi:metal-responsive CopG/Arc/MetJ family transcriptional regulator
MQSYSSNPRVAIELDADLVAWVDELVGMLFEGRSDLTNESIEQQRIQAIEEAIQLWCQQKSKQRLHHRAEQHRKRHDDDETGWLV